MDNRLGEMEVFLAVARQGSLAQAAAELRLTPSAVSRTLARLEARLGVQLIARTTRALALTAEGELYRVRAAGLLEEFVALERDFPHGEQAPGGRLRVNASVPFGVHCLIPILPAFQRAYPAITLDLALSDAVVDLVEERADVAIRIGPLRDSRLRARQLGRSTMALIASPDYLARHGTPTKPADLAGHACLRFSFRRSIDSWPFLIDGAVTQLAIDGPFMGNSGEVVRQMAVAGGGIARFARFHIAEDLAAGRLVEILAPFNPGDGEDIHALYAGHERMTARVRAFVDFLGAHVRCDFD